MVLGKRGLGFFLTHQVFQTPGNLGDLFGVQIEGDRRIVADPDDDDFVRRKGGCPKVGFRKRGSADKSRDLFETGMIGEGGEKGGRRLQRGE